MNKKPVTKSGKGEGGRADMRQDAALSKRTGLKGAALERSVADKAADAKRAAKK